MKSRFLSQKCMDFSNSSFFCSEVYEHLEFKMFCPSSVVSVVVVLRPVRPSVAVVRRRRPLSVRPSVRPVPSVRRRRHQPANLRPHANVR